MIGLRVAMEFLIVVFYIGEDVRSILLREGTALGRPEDRAPVPAGAERGGRPAGWYDAPNDADRLRYWDGTAWTDHVAPKPSATS